MERNQNDVAYRKEMDFSRDLPFDLPPVEALPVKAAPDLRTIQEMMRRQRIPRPEVRLSSLGAPTRLLVVSENIVELARATCQRVLFEYTWPGEYRVILRACAATEFFPHLLDNARLICAIQNADRFQINPLDESSYELVFTICLFRPRLPGESHSPCTLD